MLLILNYLITQGEYLNFDPLSITGGSIIHYSASN